MIFILQISWNSLFVEHGQCLIDLVQSHCWLSLLQIPYKSQTQPGIQGKLLLCKAGSPAFFFDPFANWIVVLHARIIT